MKYLDFTDLLEGDPVEIAVFSTFQFDPDYFERCLLRTPALARARRIVIFVDANQWDITLSEEIAARYINRHYLVVPVNVVGGVFHPKLHLLVRETSGMVICGSANLTRSGCTTNLELLNALPIDVESDQVGDAAVAQDSINFFIECCNNADPSTSGTARAWLKECVESITWLKNEPPKDVTPSAQLVHSYQGNIWQRIVDLLNAAPPDNLFIISPFYDKDGGFIKKVARQWPKCRIELTVQQHTTTLNPCHLDGLIDNKVHLYELYPANRRLHAKLLAWSTKQGFGCLIGSANFTLAAFNNKNVEACLLIENAHDSLSNLFDSEVNRRKLLSEDFVPGQDNEPLPSEKAPLQLHVKSAILENGRLKISYSHKFDKANLKLSAALRASNEALPRCIAPVPIRDSGIADAGFKSEDLSGFTTGMLLVLSAQINKEHFESNPVWVVQHSQLTREVSGSSELNDRQIIERSGTGLAEYLEELGMREGAEAVIAFLSRLNISLEGANSGRNSAFKLRFRDPFQPDSAPTWLSDPKAQQSLAEAIYDFVDRHESKRLRKHVSSGNINGLDNYIDIMLAMVSILFVYYRRGVIPALQVVGRLCRYIAISTTGISTSEEKTDGYLSNLVSRHKTSLNMLVEAIEESGFMAHLWVVLIIAQMVRRENRPQDGKALSTHLPTYQGKLENIQELIKINSSIPEQIVQSVQRMNCLGKQEVDLIIEQYKSQLNM